MNTRSPSNRRKRWIVVVTCAVGLFPVWLWFGVLHPVGYSPPGSPQVEEGVRYRLFVYGTLRNPLIRWLVIGRRVDTRSAWLPGFERDGLTIVSRSGARTPGEVLEVDAEAMRRLDRYERLGERYERVRVRLEDGERVWAYRRLSQSRAPSGQELQHE